MEYLQSAEVNALLKAAYDYGNREAHLCLLTMYGTGTRVSQALKLRGCDIVPDTENPGSYRVRILQAKRGQTRLFRVLASPNPCLDMRGLVELAKVRGNNKLFGGLSRHYLHTLLKRFAVDAGLHPEMVHAHTIRHSSGMRVYERTQRIGCVSGFLAHSNPASAFVYVREHDGSIADSAMAAVFSEA